MNDIALPQLPYDPSPAAFYDGSNHLVELTQSSVSTFLRCPQRFVLHYMMRLRHRSISIPLLIGSAVHAGLEIFLDPANKPDLNKPSLMKKALDACDAHFVKLESRPDLTLGKEDKINHARATANACLQAWYIVHADTISTWDILHSEWNIRAPKGTTLSSELIHRMAGKLDGMIRTADGQRRLVEHKTRSNLYSLDTTSLELDFQTSYYLLLWYSAIRMQTFADSTEPTGFIYDAIQKPQHRLSQAGWRDLCERMISAMVEDPDKYFLMHSTDISQRSLETMWNSLVKIVARMDNLSPDTVYRNQTACNDFGGCPYRNLCFEGADVSNPESIFSNPGIVGLEVASDMHPELSDEPIGAPSE